VRSVISVACSRNCCELSRTASMPRRAYVSAWLARRRTTGSACSRTVSTVSAALSSASLATRRVRLMALSALSPTLSATSEALSARLSEV